MSQKTQREKNYGKYVFRRKRGDKTEIFARVGYYDKNGQWKYKYEKAGDEKDAIAKAKEIIKQYKKRGTAFIDGGNFTFENFADWYIEKYVFGPVYEQGQQIAGFRTHKSMKLQVERLKKDFGKKKITQISDETLEQFKNKRKNLDKVKTVAINRDLELLRAMFNKAIKQGWLEESPFLRGENLIRKSLEVRRNVTTSADEEKLILDYAKKSPNIYLYPLVLALRDTGARPSEIYPFGAYGTDLDGLAEKIKTWLETEVKSDSDEQVYLPLCWFQLFKVEFQVVPLISMKSRQIEYRFGTMTQRLREALLGLWETTPNKNPVSLVFPFKTFKRSWQSVKDRAVMHTVFDETKRFGDRVTQEANLKFKFGNKSTELLENLHLDTFELVEYAEKINAKYSDQFNLQPLKHKLQSLRLRDWRRIWRTNATAAGISDQRAQRLLGHKLLETTYYYNEADLAAVIESARQMDEVNLINETVN